MEDQSSFSNISNNSYTKTTSRRPRMIVFVILFLAILGISIYVGSRFLGQSGKKDSDKTAVAPTTTLIPTETPAPSIEPTEDEKTTPSPVSKTPTTKPTAKPTAGAGGGDVDRSALTIKVLNGSGTPGEAGKMSTSLKDLGYTVSSTGNADNFDYEGVTIQVKSTKNNYLQQLKKDLAGSYTVKDATTDLPATEEADAVVIIGK